MDQIFIIKQIIEKANEYNLKASFLFIDFENAFNTVDHNFLWGALKPQGINKIIYTWNTKWTLYGIFLKFGQIIFEDLTEIFFFL